MAPLENRARSRPAWWCASGTFARLAVGLGLALSASGEAAAAALPEIRTSAQNKVPACVTPQRLMSFLKSRNPNVDKRFADIANLYKRHGEHWRVRWDYAFYQMAVETNFLSYKQGNGRWGDVDPRQNNFAGLGTTGGGVPGDRYPDVNTGVLAQIQHLVAYSGEHIPDPVGARTKLKQDDIIESVAHLKGHVTFNDLSHRWAVDRHYGASIEWVANGYRSTYCKPGAQRADAEAEPAETTSQVAAAEAAPEAAPAPKPERKVAELAPAEALGGPKVETDAAPEPAAEAAAEATPAPEPETTIASAAPDAAPLAEAAPTPAPEAAAPAAPRAVAVASVEPSAQPNAEAAPEAARVRTIWSREEQGKKAPSADEAAAAAAADTAPPATAPPTTPAAAPKAKTARAMPTPAAKTTAVASKSPAAPAPQPPAPPVPIAKADAAPPVPIAKAELAPPSLHAPEERPADDPAPAAAPAPPATAAIDPAPAPAAAAPTADAEVRQFAFAPTLNLAELSPPQPPKVAAAAAATTATGSCRVMTASYGGKKTLLVRTQSGPVTHYTALTVLEGFEASMFENFVKAHARGGASLGEYETKDAALAKARELCPGSAAAPKAEGASAG